MLGTIGSVALARCVVRTIVRGCYVDVVSATTSQSRVWSARFRATVVERLGLKTALLSVTYVSLSAAESGEHRGGPAVRACMVTSIVLCRNKLNVKVKYR